MHHIPDDVFLIAARELAACVKDEDLERGSLYPPLGNIREVSLKIAVGITKYAYCKGKHFIFLKIEMSVILRKKTFYIFAYFLLFFSLFFFAS